MEIEKEKLGPQHVGLATTYSNLGIVYQDLGDLERAKEYHIRWKLKRKTWSTTFSSRDYYSNLGTVGITGKGERISYTSDRNSERKENVGPQHVRSRDYLQQPWYSVSELRRTPERAKEYHILAMEIEKEKLGPQHVRLATTYSNLGIVYRDLGELERAKEYHILAIEIEKEKLGPQHVGLATTYSNLGIVVSELRRTGKGERISYTSDRNSERKTWSTTCWSRDYLQQPWYSLLGELRRYTSWKGLETIS